MKRFINYVAFAALGVLFVGCQDEPLPTSIEPSATLSTSSAQSTDFDFEYADHYIVGYDYLSEEARELTADAGGSIYRQWPIGYGVVGGISEEDAEELRKVDGITSVTRDIMVQWIPSSEANFEEAVRETLEVPETESDQSGAFFFNFFQWNMRVIDADAAWLATNQGSGTKVAVLDTGTDPFHQDLAGKIDGASTSVLTPGSSPCGPFDENNVFDLNFHGSFVSGLVASNGIGMASVAPDASIIGVKVLNCFGFGSFADVAAGIIYAANNGADVINMSLGALIPTDTGDDVLDEILADLIDLQQDAVDFAVENGVFVVASAGNQGLNFDDLPDFFDDQDFIHVPSMLDDVLSVGATAPIGQMNFDLLASYTNFGQHGVDVMAPGGDLVAGGDIRDLVLSVCSTFVCGAPFFYVLSAGTSFASPHAAGTAAVAIGDGEDAECVEDGADRPDGRGNSHTFSRGRINVLGAAACERLPTAD